MLHSQISYVLEQAILGNIQNPPQPSVNNKMSALIEGHELTGEEPIENPLDFFAYHDSMQLLFDQFAKIKGVLTELPPDSLITQSMLDNDGNTIYSQDFSRYIDQKVNENTKELIVHSHRLVLTKYVPVNGFKSEVGRLVGLINNNNNTDQLFKDKDGILIQPYELATIVDPNNIKGITPKDAFAQNPLHPCFKHILTPSPVMGFCLERNLVQLIGYVVHAKMLYNLVNSPNTDKPKIVDFKLRDFLAVQHDTLSALKLLEYRYNIKVDRETVKKLSEFDDQLREYAEGAFSIEYPNL